jgi:hypothetical protein
MVPDLKSFVHALLEQFGEARAAQILGISRASMLRIGCGRDVRRGTLALAEQRAVAFRAGQVA